MTSKCKKQRQGRQFPVGLVRMAHGVVELLEEGGVFFGAV
jgi:hypothetical protein